MFVYRITFANGKIYIGQTVKTPEKRLQLHRWAVQHDSQQAVHCAIRKYGWSSLRVETLYTAKTIEELNTMETFFILLHQSHKPENGYNRNLGGYKRKNIGQIPWNKGLKGAQVAWNKSLKMSAEFREKCRVRNPLTAAHARTFIKPYTEARKQKMSAKMSGSNNPFAGKKHSSETREKMRQAKLRRLNIDPSYKSALLSNLHIEARSGGSSAKTQN
jgi:hypothetical protein